MQPVQEDGKKEMHLWSTFTLIHNPFFTTLLYWSHSTVDDTEVYRG